MDKRKKGRQLRQPDYNYVIFLPLFFYCDKDTICTKMTKKVRSPCLHDVRQRPVQWNHFCENDFFPVSRARKDPRRRGIDS